MPKRTPLASQNRTYLFWLAAFVIAVTLYFAREVFIPVALAILFTFLLTPLCERLERMGVNRIAAVLTTGIFSFLCLAAVLLFVGTEFQKLSTVVPRYQTEFLGKVRSLSSSNTRLGDRFEEFVNSVTNAIATKSEELMPLSGSSTPVDQAGVPSDGDSEAEAGFWSIPGSDPKNPIFTRVVAEPRNPISRTLGSLGVVLGPLGTVGLVVVFTLFLLLYRDDLRDRVVFLFSSSGNYIVTTTALEDAAHRVSKYIVAQSMLNFGYAVTVGIGLYLIGVFSGQEGGFPNPVLWAFLCGLLRFVPYAGPVIGATFPLVVSVAAFPGYTIFLVTLGFVICLELVSNNVLEPWVYGSSTGLSSVAIIIAAVFWSWLWGPVGLLLSTPLTVCLVVFGKYVPQLHMFAILFGDESALPTPIRFYQRLLTGDKTKAERLFASEVEHQGILEAGDELLLPAIRKIRRDYEHDRLSSDAKQKVVTEIKEIVKQHIDELDEQWKIAEKLASKQNQAAAKKLKDSTVGQAIESEDAKELSDDQAPAESTVHENEPPAPNYRILCIPSHDVVEESLLQLLSNASQSSTTDILVASTRRLPSQLLREIRDDRPDVVVIGIIPPGGTLQTEFLLRQIREIDQNLPIIVAYFARVRNFDRLLVRLRKRGATYLTTTLEQTRHQLHTVVDDLQTIPSQSQKDDLVTDEMKVESRIS